MILSSGEVIVSVLENTGLSIYSRTLCGTDFDNRTTFRLALAVLSISGPYCRSSELRLRRINSKIP